MHLNLQGAHSFHFNVLKRLLNEKLTEQFNLPGFMTERDNAYGGEFSLLAFSFRKLASQESVARSTQFAEYFI